VEIGEKNNICTLTREQWDALKEKILKKRYREKKRPN